MLKKIIVTGGTGRFGNILKSLTQNKNFIFPNKSQLNILNFEKLNRYLKKNKPKILIHLAGLSRPMNIHEKDISKSIDLNIIGTANITKACKNNNIKLIYFSTNYVYPGIRGNYSETDPVLPVNNYAWSKLGGEASVRLYKNSLILRVCMTEKPFVHKKAFANVKTSFIYQEDVAKILLKVINKKGILNIGGKAKFIYDFAKLDNKYIKKTYMKKKTNSPLPFDSSLNIRKLNRIIKR